MFFFYNILVKGVKIVPLYEMSYTQKICINTFWLEEWLCKAILSGALFMGTTVSWCRKYEDLILISIEVLTAQSIQWNYSFCGRKESLQEINIPW